MAKSKCSDDHRFPPGGYVPSGKTDVAKTFARIRRELAEQKKESEAVQAEQISKVRRLK